MSLAEARVKVEIFRGPPGFADDNFVNGWSLVSVGTSSYSTDGDIVTINSGDQTQGIIEKTFAAGLSSDSYPKLEIKITQNDDYCHVYLYDGTSWSFDQGIVGIGVTEITLPTGKTYTKIRLSAGNSAGKTVKVDYVFISKTAMLTPSNVGGLNDVVELNVTLPVLEMGVAGANLTLQNINGAYTGAISQFDRIIIYIYREGSVEKKVFGGWIIDWGYKGRPMEYYIYLNCMDLGQQLQAPETLMQKFYSATNGKTIILDAVANCSVLSNKFVDVDGDIASTHTVTFDEVLPYEVVNDVCSKATTVGGVVGFDGYVDPAGNVHVFKRGKYTSSVDLTDKIAEYNHAFDCHRIRNKIKVYGKQENGMYPSTGDDWTESNIDGWSTDYLTLSNAVPSIGAKVGSGDLHGGADSTGIGSVWRTIPSSTFFGKGEFTNISWYMCHGVLGIANVTIRLRKDSNNYFEHNFAQINFKDDGWQYAFLELGDMQQWTKVGTLEWSEITQLLFYCDGQAYDHFYFDGLHFGGGRYRGEASNSVSIAKYGTRYEQPQTNDELTSDAECQLKAQSLVDFLKEPIESLNMTVVGDNNLTPGDKIHVAISNDNLDAYYRILEVRHRVEDVKWDSLLKLSNEPKMIDYIFASAAAPRYAGASVIVPRDFTTIQEGINAVVVS